MPPADIISLLPKDEADERKIPVLFIFGRGGGGERSFRVFRMTSTDNSFDKATVPKTGQEIIIESKTLTMTKLKPSIIGNIFVFA